MGACYTADAHFADPVFSHLHGEEVGAMWRMLCGRANDLRIEHSKVEADARDRLGALGGRLHLPQRAQGPQRDQGGVRVSRRADLRPPRLVRPLSLDPPGARTARVLPRLDADGAQADPVHAPDRTSTCSWPATRLTGVNDRLSASDMSSLLAERGPIHVHVGGTVIVAGKPPPFERVLGARRRPAEPGPAVSPAGHEGARRAREPGLVGRSALRSRLARAPGGAAEAWHATELRDWSAGSCPSRSTSPARSGRST